MKGNTEMKTSEHLKAARALIDTPEKWIRGEFAKTSYGVGCDPTHPEAECFCTMGAMRNVYKQEDYNNNIEWIGYKFARAALERSLPAAYWGNSIPEFNDSPNTTHNDIMALFDRAIALVENRGD